jgi:hypothetical protein
VVLVVGLALAAGDEERAPDRTADYVPRDALLYLSLGGGGSDEQAERASALVRDVPDLARLRSALLQRVTAPAGDFDWDRDIRPWLGREAAVAVVGPEADSASSLLVLSVGEEKGARDFASRVAGTSTGAAYRGTRVLGTGSVATALQEGHVLVGTEATVRASLDARAGAAPALGSDKEFRELRGALPEERVADGYASAAGVQALLDGPAAVLRGLPGATTLGAGAFAASVEAGRARLSLRFQSSGGAGGCVTRRGAATPVASGVAADVLAYVGLRGGDCLLRSLIAQPTSGVGSALRRLAAAARGSDPPVDLQRELLPLLSGEAAITLDSGGAGRPVVAAAAGDVDEARALDVLGRLQPALGTLAQAESVGQAPTFQTRDLPAGITALSAELTPNLELSYAAKGGRLILATAPTGVVAAADGRGLEQSEDFRLLLEDRPSRPSDVIFTDLDGLLTLADQLGLREEPGYLAVRDDLAKFGAAGAVISREGNQTTAEILLKTP